MVRCEEAKKVKVRGVLGMHTQFDFLWLTTKSAVFQQPDMLRGAKKKGSQKAPQSVFKAKPYVSQLLRSCIQRRR